MPPGNEPAQHPISPDLGRPLRLQQPISSSIAANHFTQLNALSHLPSNWNSYGADTPNRGAIAAAESVLLHAYEIGLLPASVDPSAENGVVISFKRSARYADVECFNSGEILAVMHDRSRIGANDPDVWTIQDDSEFPAALERIRIFING